MMWGCTHGLAAQQRGVAQGFPLRGTALLPTAALHSAARAGEAHISHIPGWCHSVALGAVSLLSDVAYNENTALIITCAGNSIGKKKDCASGKGQSDPNWQQKD